AAPDPDEAQVPVHRPLLLVDARLEELAGALLGAALAARVIRRGDTAAPGLLADAPGIEPPLDVGPCDVREQREDDDRRDAERDGHGCAHSAPPAARGK